MRVNELDVTIDHTVTIDDEYSESDLKASSRNRKTRKKKIRYENGEEVEVELSKRCVMRAQHKRSYIHTHTLKTRKATPTDPTQQRHAAALDPH